MEISVSTGLYYSKDYRETLDIISSTSCNNIELFLNERFIDVSIADLEKEVSKRKLNILSIHTPLDFIAFRRKESEHYWIDKSIELSKAFGSKVIVTHMVNGKYFDDKIEELDELHKQNMLDCRDIKTVCVTTENLPYREDGSFVRRFDELFEFVCNNGASLTFDTTHCGCGGFPIVETFKQFKDYIKNIHLSDYADCTEHKVLGEGTLPIKEFILLLKKEKYNGIITLEFDFDNKKRNNILNNEQAVSAIQKSIDLIEKNIK